MVGQVASFFLFSRSGISGLSITVEIQYKSTVYLVFASLRTLTLNRETRQSQERVQLLEQCL